MILFVFPDETMAKWGEGDPRWIVEERPDATNVNNWHWTEKNADGWSKNKLKVTCDHLCLSYWNIEQLKCYFSTFSGTVH